MNKDVTNPLSRSLRKSVQANYLDSKTCKNCPGCSWVPKQGRVSKYRKRHTSKKHLECSSSLDVNQGSVPQNAKSNCKNETEISSSSLQDPFLLKFLLFKVRLQRKQSKSDESNFAISACSNDAQRNTPRTQYESDLVQENILEAPSELAYKTQLIKCRICHLYFQNVSKLVDHGCYSHIDNAVGIQPQNIEKFQTVNIHQVMQQQDKNPEYVLCKFCKESHIKEKHKIHESLCKKKSNAKIQQRYNSCRSCKARYVRGKYRKHQISCQKRKLRQLVIVNCIVCEFCGKKYAKEDFEEHKNLCTKRRARCLNCIGVLLPEFESHQCRKCMENLSNTSLCTEKEHLSVENVNDLVSSSITAEEIANDCQKRFVDGKPDYRETGSDSENNGQSELVKEKANLREDDVQELSNDAPPKLDSGEDKRRAKDDVQKSLNDALSKLSNSDVDKNQTKDDMQKPLTDALSKLFGNSIDKSHTKDDMKKSSEALLKLLHSGMGKYQAKDAMQELCDALPKFLGSSMDKSCVSSTKCNCASDDSMKNDNIDNCMCKAKSTEITKQGIDTNESYCDNTKLSSFKKKFYASVKFWCDQCRHVFHSLINHVCQSSVLMITPCYVKIERLPNCKFCREPFWSSDHFQSHMISKTSCTTSQLEDVSDKTSVETKRVSETLSSSEVCVKTESNCDDVIFICDVKTNLTDTANGHPLSIDSKFDRSDSTQRPYACSVCNRTFESTNLFEFHIKESHQSLMIIKGFQTITYPCTECNASFSTSFALYLHKCKRSDYVDSDQKLFSSNLKSEPETFRSDVSNTLQSTYTMSPLLNPSSVEFCTEAASAMRNFKFLPKESFSSNQSDVMFPRIVSVQSLSDQK